MKHETILIVAEWDRNGYQLIDDNQVSQVLVLEAVRDSTDDQDNFKSIIRLLLSYKIIKLPCLIQTNGSLKYGTVASRSSFDNDVVDDLFSQALIHYEEMKLGLALSL